MKKTRIFALLLTVSMTFGMLSACGGDKPAANTSPAAPTDNGAPVSTAPQGESEYNGPKVTIKVGLGAASTGHSGIALQNFADRVEARTGGLVDVQCYPDSQLGTETEIAQGVALGTIEMAMPGMGTFATFYEKLQFANTPFLLDNREQSYAFYDGAFMQALNEEITQATGVKVLGYGENGVRGLSNNVREVHAPADLKGMKIRMQENPLHIQMMNLMGGSATPIAFAELYTSLSQKTVDGQDNGIPLTVNNRFYEVQKYYTTLGHCIDQLALIANDDWFSSLDPALQTILIEEGENWKWDIRQLSIDFDQSGIETMEAAGCVVTQLTPEEQQVFKDLMGPAEDTARGLVGSEFFDQVQAAVKDAGAEAETNPSRLAG